MKRCKINRTNFFGELKRARIGAVMFVVMFLSLGCNNDDDNVPGDEQGVARIEVTPEEVTLGIDEVQQFSAAVYDSDGDLIPGAEVEWFSSLPNIAHIDENGLAETQEPGTTTINAYLDDIVGNALLIVEGEAGGN